LDAERLDEVIVSTESDELAEIAREYGARVPFLRDEELSQPEVLLTDVILNALSKLESRSECHIDDETPIVVLQPNVPFTKPTNIDAAITKYQSNGHHAVISVVEERELLWKTTNGHLKPFHAERVLRSELEPLYRETGSIYVTNLSILSDGDRVGDRPAYIVTDKLSAFEVDSVIDIWLAEKIKEGPTVLFRVDGGDDIGMGHVYRCMRLAGELQSVLDCSIKFLTDSAYSGGVDKLESNGFDVVANSSTGVSAIRAIDPDIIFLDILDTPGSYVRELHELSAAVINLEDLGDGADHADYVINALYEHSTTNHNQLFGAEYFVYEEAPVADGYEVRPDVQNVLLTFGGSDPANLSTRIARELGTRDLLYRYRLVLGPDFSFEEEIGALPEAVRSQIEIFRDVPDMGELMRWADVAVCSGGRTVYELMAIGVPSIVVAQNCREADRMADLEDRGVIEYLGTAADLTDGDVADRLVALDDDYDRREMLNENATTFVDRRGIQRIMNLVHDVMIG
jgi:spore coat polysaccharide biosynthesis predicted glycosyltransferase SpsG/CMP-N-acetylneuraminic acid synthetase